ncbi:MAG: choice-of-anchor L domain-containing protein [Crocinitomicaceae bacterium]
MDVYQKPRNTIMRANALLLFVAFFGFTTNASAQNIIIDPNPTPTQLVQNTLIGPGLVTSNITFSGNLQQIGFFDENGSNLGLDSGVVMSSGYVANITPPNNPSTTIGGPGDADLLATAQSVTSNPSSGSITSTNDAAVLEFDFVPTGDVVVFNFVFGSEEYLTYVNTSFNDVFGFYITGPNPNGPDYNGDNLAIVPNTNEPITISTIHPGLNGQYYIDNPSNSGISYNGYTIPIEIRFDVICDSTYHFKFAVADCQDGILDTGVFLDGGSFQAIPVDLTLETNIGEYGDSVIVEGCGVEADFIFSRPSCQSSDSLWVNVDITGTATNGLDYLTLPDSVLFLPDSTEISIPFTAIQDGVFEGYESVILTVTNVLSSGDTIVTIGTVWLLDAPNVQAWGHDTTIVCRQDSVDIYASVLDGIPPYSFSWDTGSTDSVTWVPGTPNGSFDYYVTVTDACGFTDTDTLTLIVDQTLVIDTLIAYPSDACNPTGAVSAFVSGITDVLGQPFYHWSDSIVPNGQPYEVDATVMQNIPSGWYYFTVTDDVCSALDSVFVEPLDPPVADFSASPTSGCAPLEVTFTNSSQNTTDYVWYMNNEAMDTLYINTPGTTIYNESAVVMMVATRASCSDTAYATINVDPCPFPTVYAPNVFTPNNDSYNDSFYLTVENAAEVELIITNRWGNIVFQHTATNPTWDGKSKTPSGADCAEGVYFYRYKVTGVVGDILEGHGFVHLVRD